MIFGSSVNTTQPKSDFTQDLSLYRIPEDLEQLTQILKGILDQTHSPEVLAI